MESVATTALEALRAPHPDSPCALDRAWCATRPTSRPDELLGLLAMASEHAAELLRVACEHSIAVERLLQAPEILPVPMMSLVRSIHEAFLEICWLADPTVSPVQRLVRAASTFLNDVESNIAPLEQTPGQAAELQRVQEASAEARALLQRLGFTLRLNGARTQVTTIQYEGSRAPLKLNTTELNKTYMPGTEHMWTLGSGGTHSRNWFTAGIEGPRSLIATAVVGPALDSCDYVADNVLGYVGQTTHAFHSRTHLRRNALLLGARPDDHRGPARAGYAEYDATRRGTSVQELQT